MFRRILGLLIFALFLGAAHAQNVQEPPSPTGAKAVVDRAVADSSSGKSLSAVAASVEKSAETANSPEDRRALYSFLGSLWEQSGNYTAASRAYAIAAGIAAGTADNMPRLSAEQLALNAVRCALSAGDFVTADNYLASSVKNSTDPVISAYVKLYGLWSKLCQVQGEAVPGDTLEILRANSANPSLEPVRPALLLSLWYLEGDAKSAETLAKNYPLSPEAAIVGGRAELLPAPFWFFSPRKEPSVAPTPPRSAAVPGLKPAAESAPKASDAKVQERAVRQQLGLFRSEDNARQLAENLIAKGFTPAINQEVRGSGVRYYAVSVAENPLGTVGAALKKSGFDCYPVYE